MVSYSLCLTTVLVFIYAVPGTLQTSDEIYATKSTNKFAFYLQKVLSRDNPNNLVSSPISLQILLTMAALGLDQNSTSYKELKSLFKYPDDQSEMVYRYILLSDSLTSSPNVLNFANGIFIDKKFTVDPEYLGTISNYFNGETKQVNFASNYLGARRKINKWVKKQTKGKITELLYQGCVASDTKMILVSGLYFKSDWYHAFDKRLTQTETFYVDETRQIDVDMMQIKSEFLYYDSYIWDAKFLMMPFKDDEYSMLLILPDSKTGIEDLVNDLPIMLGHTGIPSALKLAETIKVFVKLPKFQISQTLDMVEPLKELGVEGIFTESDFKYIDPASNLQVTNIYQQVFVTVDEGGTEAAGRTDIEFQQLQERWLPGAKMEFIADHPFVFVVYKKYYGRLGVPLLTGIYKGE